MLFYFPQGAMGGGREVWRGREGSEEGGGREVNKEGKKEKGMREK